MAESTSKPNIASDLAEKLLGIFDGGFDGRRAYYEDNPGKVPSEQDLDALISTCANTNAAISGSLSLIPGPWGLLATVPEIVLVIRNQVQLIYDIGVASGKRDVLTRELILSIALSASGVSAMSLITMHGSKILVRRSSLQVFQKLITVFAGKVTQQLLKSSIAKWLPIVGAAGIAIWTRYTTAEIGKKARDLFSHEIEILPEEGSESPALPAPAATPHDQVFSRKALVAKLLLLNDLMRCDADEAIEEQTFINEKLARSELSDVEQAQFLCRLPEPFPRTIDLTPFQEDHNEAVALLMDMVALAKRDGQIRPQERELIMATVQALGMGEKEVVTALI